jgi:hypothetical protein
MVGLFLLNIINMKPGFSKFSRPTTSKKPKVQEQPTPSMELDGLSELM